MRFHWIEKWVICWVGVMLLTGSGCGDSGGKAWEKEPPITLTKTSTYPKAGNYQPVIDDGYFFEINLSMSYGEPVGTVDEEDLEIVECFQEPGIFDLPNLMSLYDQHRSDQEGSFFIVISSEPDVPLKLVFSVMRLFRLHGVFQFYLRVTPSDGTDVGLAVLPLSMGPYSTAQLQAFEQDSICMETAVDGGGSISIHNPTTWDPNANGKTNRPQTLQAITSENRILLNDEYKFTMGGETYSLGGLGNHLRRIQELSDVKEQFLFGFREDLRYENLVETLDQVILSGIGETDLLSPWEYDYLSVNEKTE